MSILSNTDLADLLEWAAGRVRAGDSFEGRVQWTFADGPDNRVSAAIRLDNLNGQGCMLIEDAEIDGANEPGLVATDPPIGLDDLERRAARDAQRLDGLHGDPSRAGGWIGHRDYARALVLLIPRLRKAEAELRDRRAAEQAEKSRADAIAAQGECDLETYRAFKDIDTAATFAELNALWAQLSVKLCPADRADAERRYYEREAWLEAQASKEQAP